MLNVKSKHFPRFRLFSLQYCHPVVLPMFFSPHFSGMSKLVLMLFFIRGSPTLGRKKKKVLIPYCSPPTQLGTSSQQCIAKIPAQEECSASCSQLRIKFSSHWKYNIAIPMKKTSRFSFLYLHIHLSPKGCLLAITARTQLFHSDRSGGGRKYCQDLQLRTKHLKSWQ